MMTLRRGIAKTITIDIGDKALLLMFAGTSDYVIIRGTAPGETGHKYEEESEQKSTDL